MVLRFFTFVHANMVRDKTSHCISTRWLWCMNEKSLTKKTKMPLPFTLMTIVSKLWLTIGIIHYIKITDRMKFFTTFKILHCFLFQNKLWLHSFIIETFLCHCNFFLFLIQMSFFFIDNSFPERNKVVSKSFSDLLQSPLSMLLIMLILLLHYVQWDIFIFLHIFIQNFTPNFKSIQILLLLLTWVELILLFLIVLIAIINIIILCWFESSFHS